MLMLQIKYRTYLIKPFQKSSEPFKTINGIQISVINQKKRHLEHARVIYL